MIKKVNQTELPLRFRSCKVQQDLFEFHDSDWDACEVDISDYKNATTARVAYDTAAKRLGIGVTAITRNNRLFLIRNAENA